MNWTNLHRVWALCRCPRKLSTGAQTLCMIFLLCLASSSAHADCPAAPMSSPDDMVVSFLASESVQAASGSLFASTVKEGMLIYDDTANTLKVCDGTNWVDVGSGSGADTLTSLSCASGEIAKYNGAAWACAVDGGGGSSQWTTLGNDLHYGTGGVAIGQASAPDASAALELESTTKGFLPPRLTTTQRNAVASPATGLMIFNTTVTQYQFWNGTAWSGLGSGGVPTGTITAFASATCPSGWTEYTAARGRFLRGIDNGAGNDPSGTRAPGNVQTDKVGPHVHDTSGNRIVTDSGGVGLQNGATRFWNGNYPVVANTITSGGDVETRPKNVAVIFCQYSGSGGGGGATALADLTDIDLAGLANGKVLTYNSTSSKWEATTPATGGTPAPSNGYVQFNNAGAFGADANLFWDNTNKRLGIGTATPAAVLDVITKSPSGLGIRIAGDHNQERFVVESGTPVFQASHYRGTLTAKTASQAGDVLGYFQGGGHDGTTQRANEARMRILATENHSPTNQGTAIDFQTTPNGSPYTSIATRMTVNHDGNVGIGTATPATKLDVNGPIQAGTGIFVAKGATSAGLSLHSGSAPADQKNTYLSTDTNGDFVAYTTNDANTVPQIFLRATRSANTTPTVNFPNGNVGIGTTAPGAKLEVRDGMLMLTQTVLPYNGGNYSTGFPTADGTGVRFASTGTSPVVTLQAADGTSETANYLQGYIGSTGKWLVTAGGLFRVGDGSATYPALSFSSDNNTGFFSPSPNYGGVAFSGNGAERLRIDASGNVGIGTASPQRALHVTQSTATPNTLIALENPDLTNGSGTVVSYRTTTTGTGAATFVEMSGMTTATMDHNHATRSSTLSLFTTSNGSLAHRLVIADNGDVGIGKTNPSAPLDVAGSTKSQSTTASGYGVQGTALTSTIYGILGYNNTWGVVCNGTSCGGNQAWTNYSDARLKERVHALSEKDGLDTIMRLRPVRFHWRDAGQDRAKGEQLGLIAQDVQKVLPEILGDPIDSSIELPDGSKEEIKGTLNVSYATLVVPLIKAVQELKAENDNLRIELKTANDNHAQMRAMLEEQGRAIDALKAAR